MALVIGVAGGSGSGKTTTVARLIDRLGPGNALVLAHDRYYRDRRDLPTDARAALNFDHPDALDTELIAEHVAKLRAGQAIEAPVYDFARHTRQPVADRIDSRPVIFLEGVLVLADARLRELMDLRVFVETDDATRYARRLKRDISERGRTAESVESQYTATVLPMHREFVAPSRHYADVVVTEGGFNDDAIAHVLQEIRRLMGTGR